MSHDTRILVAFTLSFLVLVIWRAFMVKEQPVARKTALAPQTRPAPAPQPSTTTTTKTPIARPSSLPIRQGSKPEDIVIDGDLYQVTLSTQGGVVKSWVLKKYRDADGKPLDVVNRAACEKLGFPMSLNLPDQDLSSKLNSALYVARVTKLVAGHDAAALPGPPFEAPIDVELTYSDGAFQAEKQFRFGPGYEVHTEVTVFDGRSYKPVEVAWPGGFGDQSLPPAQRNAATLAVYGNPGDITTVAQRKVKEDRLIPAPLTLAGAEDRFFASVFLPDSPGEAAFHFGRRLWTPPGSKDALDPLVTMLGSPQPKPLAFRLVVAPKDLDVLRSFKPPLDRLVDFGWFSFVAKPLFVILRYIYDHLVHNYGWAIVILTLVINMAMFPLKLKQLRSAQEMQRIAPLVKNIQDRYKQYKFNDPRKQRMNEEVMKLYQEHGINPLGGCLPMLIQIPFLYGFYRVLDNAIELRHARWIWCIWDLSAPDRCHLFGIPLAILPTVMIVTMYVLQQMTPVATADPAQQRMMKFMPLVFGIMFYNFAAGLVLYWLTSNVVGIAQQAFINHVMPASSSNASLSPRSNK